MKKLVALGMIGMMATSLAACGGSAQPAATSSSAKSTSAASSSAKSTSAASSSAASTSAASSSAASTSAAAGKETAITLWTYPVGSWGDNATVNELVADFNAQHPEIKVSVEYLDYTNGDDQVNTAIEGGQAPDMVLEGPERLVANWGAKGYMADLSDIMSEDAASDLYDTVKEACTSTDGKVYEYPLCMVAHSMAVNKNMLEAADAMQYIDEATNTWKSSDDFLKAVQAVYDSGHQDVLAVYCSGQGGDQGTRALVNNLYSGTFTNPEHTEYTANSDANIKALEALKNQQGVKFDASIAGGDEINLFRQNVLAMALCWNAAQQNNTDAGNEAGKTNSGDTILAMNFPTDDGKVELCGGIWGFGVFDNGDPAKVDASKEFIRFMANSDETVKAVKASGFFPVHQNMENVYAGSDIADTMDMFTKNFMPNMGDYYQVVPGWATARTEWWNMLQRIGTGGDVKTEVETFTTNANAAAKQG